MYLIASCDWELITSPSPYCLHYSLTVSHRCTKACCERWCHLGIKPGCLYPSFMLPNHGAQQGDPGDTLASPSSCFLSSGSSSSQSLLVSPVETQPETKAKVVADAATIVASEPRQSGVSIHKTEHVHQPAHVKIHSPCCCYAASSAFE